VTVQKVADSENLVIRQLSLESAGRRAAVLKTASGQEECLFGPVAGQKGPTSTRATLVVCVLRPASAGGTAQVMVSLLVETSSAGGDIREFAQAFLPVPAGTALPALLREPLQSGEQTAGTSVLRLESGGKFLEVAIE
jgi:hypothetical protein